MKSVIQWFEDAVRATRFALRSASELASMLAAEGFPRGAVYPLEEGIGRVEWTYKAWDISLEVRGSEVYGHALNLEMGSEREYEFDLGKPSDVERLKGFLECLLPRWGRMRICGCGDVLKPDEGERCERCLSGHDLD